MDPDETLAELLRLARKARDGVHGARPEPTREDAERFMELFEALEGWMARGGFPPKRWSQALAHELDVMKLDAAGSTAALDSGTWGTGWRSA